MIFTIIKQLRNHKKSKRDILRLQWKTMQKSLDYAYYNVPFYKEQFDNAGIKPADIKSPEDLLKIPVTTKKDLRKHAETTNLIAKKYKKKKLKHSITTGSTGQPTTTYFTKKDWFTLKYFLKFRSKWECGARFLHSFVHIDDRPPEESSAANKKIINRLLKKFNLSVSDSLENHITAYKTIKPDILYGMPSYFIELMHFIKEKNITWLKPKIIFTSSEILDKTVRKELEQTFNCPVYDIYGSTELKEVSWECKKQQGYHINADSYYVEFVKEDKHVKPLEKGHIIITSFNNCAMPLIRYSLGDTGMYIDDDCTCGCNFPMMKTVLGRSVDYIRLPDNRSIAPFTLTNTLQDCAAQHIAQYQIVQTNKNTLIIKIVPNKQFSDEIKESIVSAFQSLLGPMINIKIELLNQIPREPSGKYKVVKSEVLH